MNILAKLASVIVGGTLVLSGASARATGTFEEHIVLWNSLQSAGVTTLLNDPEWCSNGSDGLYYSRDRVLVVCQDNSSPISSKEVNWTSNDLDTLRHEAHHVLQDCLEGRLGDSETKLLFEEEGEFFNFINNRLTQEQVRNIVEAYEEQGASDDVIIKEIEAFAVASSTSPAVIADGINSLCRL